MTGGPAGELAGRVVLVTGGGWNLGRAVAERLASAGARVALASRNAERLGETANALRSAGHEALAVPMDCTDSEQVTAGVATIASQLGPVDALAAFAGGGGVPAEIDAGDPDEWWRTVEQNVRTAQLATRAVLPTMRERNAGTILYAVGGGAFFPVVGVPISAYACAQAALCRLTDQLAVDLFDTGIRVNALEPGNVGSPGEATALASAAELAQWLLSDASRPLTGRSVSVLDDWWRDPARVREVAESHHRACLRRADP